MRSNDVLTLAIQQSMRIKHRNSENDLGLGNVDNVTVSGSSGEVAEAGNQSGRQTNKKQFVAQLPPCPIFPLLWQRRLPHTSRPSGEVTKLSPTNHVEPLFLCGFLKCTLKYMEDHVVPVSQPRDDILTRWASSQLWQMAGGCT